MKRLFILWVLIFVTACSAAQPFVTPTNVPAPSALQTDTAVPPSPTEVISGPWLMLPGPDGLWAFDTADGSFALVENRHLLAPQDITAMPSPAGGSVAFITGVNGIEELTLNVISLPGLSLRTQQLIAPERYPPANAQPGDPSVEAVRALFEVTSIAWAPDGQSIAFTGILEGPSADLYILPVDRPVLHRLTETQGHEIQPIWTSDGRHVVYAAVETFGTGAGYTMSGVWRANTDGSGSTLLYDTGESGGESFVGWLDESTLLVHSWSAVCGNEKLRKIDVESGIAAPVWEGPFNGVALDPRTGNILLSLDTFTANCSEAVEQGLYFISGTGNKTVRITSDEAFLPNWDSVAGFFLARTPTAVLAVGPGGSTFQLQGPEPSLPAANRAGGFAWASPISGIWIAHLNEEARQVYFMPAFIPVWSPNGNTLYFFAEGGFYAAFAPLFEPQLLKEGLASGGAFWLEKR